jgi:hypothetical protein
MVADGRRTHFFGAFSAPRQYVLPRASPKLHPFEELNGSLDILTVKSRLDRPTLAGWKAMKTQADGILAIHRRFLGGLSAHTARRCDLCQEKSVEA